MNRIFDVNSGSRFKSALLLLALFVVLAGISSVHAGEDRFVPMATFFSRPFTGDTEIRDNLIELIDGARHSIDAHFYQVNCPEIISAFSRAARRLPGGKLRFITDDKYRNRDDYADGYRAMERAGVRLIDDTEGGFHGRYESHNKFAVFDGQWVWTGSFNVTVNGYSRHNENGIAIRCAALAREYTKEFEEMFVNNRFSTWKRTDTINNLGHIEVYMCPDRDSKEAILREIRNARHKIFFAMFVFTDRDIRDALIEKHRQGVEVWGTFDNLAANSQYSARHGLLKAGAKVVRDGGSGLMHHKFMVIDPGYSNPVVITGSMNWTNQASRYNDENFLIIRDNQDIAMDYFNEFLHLWEQQRTDERTVFRSPEAGPAAYDAAEGDAYSDALDKSEDLTGSESAGAGTWNEPHASALAGALHQMFAIISSFFQ